MKKRFFAKHAKSSAALVSLGIHAVLVVVALFFVAVTVIHKDEVDFEAKPVSRPRMNLRKLQVPVNVRKAKQKPKLRQRIVVAPKLNQTMPDIKLPELTGVKGGLGGAGGGGLGGGGNLGFTMPKLDFFGIKGKGEKIIIILDGSQYMSSDELGGADGFEVIKSECLALIERLPPTAVFNIIVYGGTRQLFPGTVSATPANVRRAKEWLTPLNQPKGTQTRYGVDTLGSGGDQPKGEYPFGKFAEELFYPRAWNEPVLLAMRQRADTVFLLTGGWGYFGYDMESSHEVRQKWNQTSAGKTWAERVEKGRRMLDEDNAKRVAAGKAKRALNGGSELEVVRAYFPGTPEPAHAPRANLRVGDLVEVFQAAYTSYAKETPQAGLRKKSKSRFALHVVYFKAEKFADANKEKYSNEHAASFAELAKALQGEFRSIASLRAIESYVK